METTNEITQMNTLTPNRILQKGDEYRDNGTWKAVPKDDFGLQVMFTKYAEVRRPSEIARSLGGTPAPEPESISFQALECSRSAVEPAPSEKGCRVTTNEKEIEANGLPTVVSRKAHTFKEKGVTMQEILREPPETSKKASTEVAKSPAAPIPSYTEVTYPDWPHCIWIGRNGTFRQRGLSMVRLAPPTADVIRLMPIGARGRGRNAQVELPKSAIPQVIEFLQKQL